MPVMEKDILNINIKYCIMKKLFFLLSFLLLSFSVSFAQTRAYKYLYAVKDDVKISGPISKGNIYYFTFTNNKSMCYLTNKDGVYSGGYGINSYKFVGEKDGVLIYMEQDRTFLADKQDMLYFSSDYKRLNAQWKVFRYDPVNAGCTLVLEYVADPNSVDVPSQLY